MKTQKIIIIIVALGILSCKSEPKEKVDSKMNHKNHQEEKSIDTSQKKPLSPHTETMAMIGGAHIHIDYSSPRVRERIIFGGLVSYNNVWQSGAHNATWVETSKNLLIDGKILPAGKYGFFTIPSKEKWTVIFNTNWEQHGKDEYDIKKDVVRFEITPIISEEIQEHLQYRITKTNENEGVFNLSWEKITISFPFKVQQ